jgi:hypothetical protein
MRLGYATPQARFAARQHQADGERADGIPDRTDPPTRSVRVMDYRDIGGPCWRCTPREGYQSYRVHDNAGRFVMCGPMKSILRAMARALPKPTLDDDCNGYTTRDEADAADANDKTV